MSDFAVSKHVPCNQRHALILLVREGYLVDSTRSTSSFPSMSPEDEIGPPRRDSDITLYWRQEVSQSITRNSDYSQPAAETAVYLFDSWRGLQSDALTPDDSRL